MDIPRNWRLKTARAQLIATVIDGEVTLPHQGIKPLESPEIYVFEEEKDIKEVSEEPLQELVTEFTPAGGGPERR